MTNARRHIRPILARLALVVLLATSTGGCLAHHTGPMPGEPENATFAQLGDTRVRYTDDGEGDAVVLIHGFASSLETWLTVVPAIAEGRRIITLDLKGFGWTDRPAGDYSPRAQAGLVFALMDELGVARASVVAHSWGCSVALAMALEQPDRVDRVALYDAWVYADQLPSSFYWSRADGLGEALTWLFYDERPAEKLAHAFFDPSMVPQGLVDEVKHALERPGTKAAALAAIRGQRYEDVEDQYRTIAQPVLLIWGDADKVARIEFGQRLLKELPNARLVSFARVGHFPMLEAIGASNSALAAFLDEGSPAVSASAAQPDPNEAVPGSPTDLPEGAVQ